MQNFIPISILGEFLGTLLLVILGNGVVFSVTHTKMMSNQPGKWILVALGWGLGVFAGALIALALDSPAHLNPVVSIYSSIAFLNPNFLIYIPFQLLGAMVGQGILNFINYKHIIATAKDNPNATRGAHYPTPAFDNKKDKAAIFNFSYEFIGTFVLLLAIFAISKLDTGFAQLTFPFPIPVSLVIMAIGISLGGSTGYAINPARDLGPRIVYAISRDYFSKQANHELVLNDWSYSWIPILAPSIAACIMGGLARIGV